MKPHQVIIHGIQSVIAIIILGLSIYKLAHEASTAFALAVFTAIATILVAIYICTTSFIAKSLYKIWIHIGSDIFIFVFSMVTVGLLAAMYSFPDGYDRQCHHQWHQYCNKKRSNGHEHEHDWDHVWIAVLVLSIVDGLLSVVSIGVWCYNKKKEKRSSVLMFAP